MCYKPGTCDYTDLLRSTSAKLEEGQTAFPMSQDQLHMAQWHQGQLTAQLRLLMVPFLRTKIFWGLSVQRGKRIQVAGKVPWVGHCCPEFKPISLFLVLLKEDVPQLNRLNYLKIKYSRNRTAESNFCDFLQYKCYAPIILQAMQTNCIQVIMQTVE